MEEDYKFIIKTCYNLPFNKNIQKIIGKEIKNAFGKKINIRILKIISAINGKIFLKIKRFV